MSGKFIFTLNKILYNFIMESRTIPSATTPSDSVLTVDSSSTIVVDSTSSSAKVDSCSASARASVVTVTDSDVLEPAMAVLHTIASSDDDGSEASDGSSVTQEHVEQIDASLDELEILEAESVAAAAAVAAANARLRFLRARRTSALVSQASARSASSAPGPAVRPLCFPGDLSDRGPLATVPQRPEVRHAVEPPHRAAVRRQKEREERWEKERRDQERSRFFIERRNARRVIPSDIPYHLSGQRVLGASGIDFAGNVVIPELPPMPGATTPAVQPANIVLLPLREEHFRDRVHDPAPDVVQDPVLHGPEPAPSDRSSMVARLRQRISELESVRLRQRIAEQEAARLRQRISELDSKFEGGVSIPVPDNSSSYATAAERAARLAAAWRASRAPLGTISKTSRSGACPG